MAYFSTKDKAYKVSLSEAVIKGQAPQQGLFMPEVIPVLPSSFYEGLIGESLPDISLKIAWALFRNDMDLKDLKTIIDDALAIEIPLVQVDEHNYALELFHGPTCAFKDVGARFMARLLGHFLKNSDKQVTVLVATSGDTGSAVANGFLNVPGIDVVILYPSGKVSHIQEQQLTTLGNNITALEVDGVFDDCQALVKQAFTDTELTNSMELTSANSINIARLIPQSFYYHYAWSQLQAQKPNSKPVFSVPSGNFGNLSAGLIAKRMGLPVEHFIAATNANNVVPEYLESGIFSPRPSVATISNAMDVGNPSNFARMMELYHNDVNALRSDLTGYSYTDAETKETMKQVHDNSGYVLDPHGAVAYRALLEYQKHVGAHEPGIFLGTAHPAKFKDVVDSTLGIDVELPESLQSTMHKKKEAISMPNNYNAFKQWLLNR